MSLCNMYKDILYYMGYNQRARFSISVAISGCPHTSYCVIRLVEIDIIVIIGILLFFLSDLILMNKWAIKVRDYRTPATLT